MLIQRAKENIDVWLILSDDFVDKDKIRFEIFKKLIKQIRHTDEKKKKKRYIGLSIANIGYLVTTLVLVIGFAQSIQRSNRPFR